MTEAVFALVTIGIGACIGWLVGRRQTRPSKRMLALVGAFLILSPAFLFMLASFLESDALGWIAGLSVMIALVSAAPIALGAAVGWTWARRSHRPALLADRDLTTQGESLHNSVPTALDVPPPPIHASGKQRGVLLAMAGVPAGFWVMLAVGFRINDQPAPSGLDSGLMLASLVLVTTLIVGVRYVWQNRGTSTRPFSFSVPGAAPRRSDAMAERRAWLATLAADPHRQRYAAMIDAGDSFWTPDRIDYDLDPHATTCCQHLAPIESAMRAAGLSVRMDAVGSASAGCRIDADVLAREFSLAPTVAYEERVAYDRSLEDPQQARLGALPTSSNAAIGWSAASYAINHPIYNDHDPSHSHTPVRTQGADD
jgi:hypothetical protein